MSSIPNYNMKKNNTLGIKPKKKSIPININTNPTPGKFLFSNHVNNIASSYLSMGQRIQINKNLKPKIIHVNTNSATNYYTINSKDTKYTNGSITNSIINNLKNNNKSELNSINVNNYINLSNNNNNINHTQLQNYDINRFNNININSKERKHISTLSNSKLSNDKLINGYQSSKNNQNNSKYKNKINNTSNINNLSKNKQTYSTRPNFLDSKNKTKKMPMKSKIRQYRFQYKNNKPISTSFNNVYSTKRHFQGNHQKDLYSIIKADLLSNINTEKNYDNIFDKNHIHYNLINNKNIYEIKYRHNRHNTASFGNKEIMNIFHKKNLSNNIIKNLNIINNINDNNDKNTNINKKKNNFNLINNNKEKSIGLGVLNGNNNIINKINISNNSKKKLKKLCKGNGKIQDIKILVNDKKSNLKENKYTSNNIVNGNINGNTNGNHNFYYTKYLSNNYHSNNNSNIIHHHIKNPTANNLNINNPEIKKILVKPKDRKKNINNQNKYIKNPIPTPGQKIKSNIIPSQRNIKINLTKFLQGVKTKQNRTKILLGRKSFSIKKIKKENNSDFSLPQFNDKLSNKLLKNNEEENDVISYNYHYKNNENIMKKIKKERNQENEKNEELIEKKLIKAIHDFKEKNNNNNKLNAKDKIKNNHDELIKAICRNNNKNSNINNYNEQICYSNNSTSNNIYYGKNKNDYSIDNIPEPINNYNNMNNINKIIPKRKKSIENNLPNLNGLNLNLNTSNKNDIFEEKKDIDFDDFKNNKDYKDYKEKENEKYNENEKKIKLIISNQDKFKENKKKKLIDNKIKNDLFDEDNLDELPEDYDENFNDLYSIINKINFGSVLVCVEGLFTPEGRTYKKYKDKFDKYYDKLFIKKGNSFANSNNKPKKIVEVAGLTSNTKTNSSSSKKNIINANDMYNDLNIVKVLNVNC